MAVQEFIDALRKSEESHDPAELIKCFSGDAELWRQTYSKAYNGEEGAKQFWSEYLAHFKTIESDFSNIQERDDLAVLEWESHGELNEGGPFRYRGVSILNLSDEGKVKSFRTYFDSSAFVTHEGEAKH